MEFLDMSIWIQRTSSIVKMAQMEKWIPVTYESQETMFGKVIPTIKENLPIGMKNLRVIIQQDNPKLHCNKGDDFILSGNEKNGWNIMIRNPPSNTKVSNASGIFQVDSDFSVSDLKWFDQLFWRVIWTIYQEKCLIMLVFVSSNDNRISNAVWRRQQMRTGRHGNINTKKGRKIEDGIYVWFRS